MLLETTVIQLEREFKDLFQRKSIEQAADLVFSVSDYVFSLAEKWFNPKALRELRFKYSLNWPDGSGMIRDLAHSESMRITRERRYSIERNLLRSKHPRRVDRLWNEAKPILEKRYGMVFNDRRDIAILNGLYEHYKGLHRELKNLKEAKGRLNAVRCVWHHFPCTGWEEIFQLYKNHDFWSNTKDVAEKIIGLLKDLDNPFSMVQKECDDQYGKHYDDFDEEWKHTDLINPMKDSGDLPNPDWVWHYRELGELEHFTQIIIQDKMGKLPFSVAVDLLASGYAKNAGMEVEHPYIEWRHEFPDTIQDILDKRLTKGYANKAHDAEASQFLDWFKTTILSRWEQTYEDYDRLFDYHFPNKTDKELIKFFYKMRNGIEANDAQIEIDRLPGLIRAMIADGIIEENDVRPPLKERYLKPNEIFIFGKNRITDGKQLQKIMPVIYIQHEPRIVTSAAQVPLLPGVDQNLPEVIQKYHNLEAILDPEANYEIIFKGKHTMFFASTHQFNNNKMLRDIYRISLLREGVTHKEGVVINVHGRPVHIKKEKSYEEESEMRGYVYDANTDSAPIRNATVIVDISPDEFKQKYWTDFMAHVIIHRCDILGGIESMLSQAEKWEPREIGLELSSAGHAYFHTFELGGKFCFRLKYDSEMGGIEIPRIANTLTSYLDDVGLAYHTENNIDESGRAVVKNKLKEREFQARHFERVRNALEGPKITDIILFARHSEQYEVSDLSESHASCKYCGRKYMSGRFTAKGEQWFESIDGDDLHMMSAHPSRFINKWGSFRKLEELVSSYEKRENDDYIPVFIKHPIIMPWLSLFAEKYMKYLDASGKSYQFWEGTQGGIHAEEEVLEDDPGLRQLRLKETLLNRREARLRKKALETAHALTTEYENLAGKDAVKDIKYPLNFWGGQLMDLKIYQVNAPALLPGGENAITTELGIGQI